MKVTSGHEIPVVSRYVEHGPLHLLQMPWLINIVDHIYSFSSKMMQRRCHNTKTQKHVLCTVLLKVSPFAKLSIKPALRSSSSSKESPSEPEPREKGWVESEG